MSGVNISDIAKSLLWYQNAFVPHNRTISSQNSLMSNKRRLSYLKKILSERFSTVLVCLYAILNIPLRNLISSIENVFMRKLQLACEQRITAFTISRYLAGTQTTLPYSHFQSCPSPLNAIPLEPISKIVYGKKNKTQRKHKLHWQGQSSNLVALHVKKISPQRPNTT